jgi:hypothetical protein
MGNVFNDCTPLVLDTDLERGPVLEVEGFCQKSNDQGGIGFSDDRGKERSVPGRQEVMHNAWTRRRSPEPGATRFAIQEVCKNNRKDEKFTTE